MSLSHRLTTRQPGTTRQWTVTRPSTSWLSCADNKRSRNNWFTSRERLSMSYDVMRMLHTMYMMITNTRCHIYVSVLLVHSNCNGNCTRNIITTEKSTVNCFCYKVKLELHCWPNSIVNRGMCCQIVSPSVCLSVTLTPKWFKISTYTSHHTIQGCF